MGDYCARSFLLGLSKVYAAVKRQLTQANHHRLPGMVRVQATEKCNTNAIPHSPGLELLGATWAARQCSVFGVGYRVRRNATHGDSGISAATVRSAAGGAIDYRHVSGPGVIRLAQQVGFKLHAAKEWDGTWLPPQPEVVSHGDIGHAGWAADGDSGGRLVGDYVCQLHSNSQVLGECGVRC